MNDKQVYDLGAIDIQENGVWYFPMDDTVKDELTVRPVNSQQLIDADYQIIVRTRFRTADATDYLGYVYWSSSCSVEDLKPVMFIGESGCISFWSGVVEPAWANYPPVLQIVRLNLPVSFASEVLFDLDPISGILEGLYSFKDGKIVAFP